MSSRHHEPRGPAKLPLPPARFSTKPLAKIYTSPWRRCLETVAPYAEDAVRLRRWDDVGKVAGLETPGLEHYRPVLEAALK